jgi:hypothetical protein
MKSFKVFLICFKSKKKTKYRNPNQRGFFYVKNNVKSRKNILKPEKYLDGFFLDLYSYFFMQFQEAILMMLQFGLQLVD